MRDIKGHISIHTENILPIIKKWLYSEHDIFLRELISNAFDAITKLQKIAVVEGVSDIPAPKINILINATDKTITIRDTGLGMDAEEVQKYINQIAFSSAEEFVEKYKNKDEKAQIIGHFGLGFYSAFMVADTVEIVSKSYKKDATAVQWRCEGSTDFSLTDSTRTEIGTDVILHINAENESYLTESKITELVQKYSNFLPVEIQVNDKAVNDQNPLWAKKPTEVKDEDYKSFYQKLFPFSPEPLFWIHLNVDYPFNLQGILYFPKILHELDASKGRIKLFCNQVFVTDDAKEVVPEFLTLLQGAIDCPDIPLNVSRSYLQNDPYVQKIAKHIVKKVADKLTELFKTDRENFEKFWGDISPFIKYGMMQNAEFYDKVQDIVLFPSSNGGTTSVADYLGRNTGEQVFYCADKDTQATYVQLFKDQGKEVIFLESIIDAHFIQFLESKSDKTTFVAVDSDVANHLVSDTKITDAEKEKIAGVFKTALGTDKVRVEPLKSESISAMIVESEHAKRFKVMSAMMRGQMPPMPDDFTLVINSESPVIKAILATSDEKKQAALCQHVHDLAMMSKKQLTGEQLQAFVARSNQLLSHSGN